MPVCDDREHGRLPADTVQPPRLHTARGDVCGRTCRLPRGEGWKALGGQSCKYDTPTPMKLTLTDIHLPMRHAFTIAHGTTTVQHNLLVELSDGTHTGYGEGASSHAWAEYSAESMR